MPSNVPIRRLEDILANIQRIERYTRGYDFQRFSKDQQCQDAVERCLARISEAAKKLEDRWTCSLLSNPGRIFDRSATYCDMIMTAFIQTPFGRSSRTTLIRWSRRLSLSSDIYGLENRNERG